MNRAGWILVGVWGGLAASFWGLVLVPHRQLGHLTQIKLEATDSFYPQGRSGPARRGAEVYRALGCAECHTQQVRPRSQGSDFERGWGQRRTVAQDYLHDYPVLLGTQRIGPDLANIGARQPEPERHFRRLYAPRLLNSKSLMPPYAFLFRAESEEPSAGRRRSGEAAVRGDLSLFPAVGELRAEKAQGTESLRLPGAVTRLVVGHRGIVPSRQAQDLVAYLLSLRSDTPLFEAPVLGPRAAPTNGAAGQAAQTASEPKP